MANEPAVSRPSSFAQWVKRNKKMLTMMGAVVAITTYIFKERFQLKLETEIRSIESWQSEARITDNLLKSRANLRDELSRGLDPQKKNTNQDQTLSLHVGEYPPSYGSPNLKFYHLVAIECGEDDLCQAAEWYRYRDWLQSRIDENERLAEILETTPLVSLDLALWKTEIDKHRSELELAEKYEKNAFDKMTTTQTPSHEEVNDFVSTVNSVETKVDAFTFELKVYAIETIEKLRRGILVSSIVAGVLFFMGWSLSLLGHLYDVDIPSSAE